MTLYLFLCLIGRMEEQEYNWELAARGLLKSEMVRRDLSYGDLSDRLVQMGVEKASPNNLRSKINRGTFSAVFLIQALIAMGCDEVTIRDLPIYRQFIPQPGKHGATTSTVHEGNPNYVKPGRK